MLAADRTACPFTKLAGGFAPEASRIQAWLAPAYLALAALCEVSDAANDPFDDILVGMLADPDRRCGGTELLADVALEFHADSVPPSDFTQATRR